MHSSAANYTQGTIIWKSEVERYAIKNCLTRNQFFSNQGFSNNDLRSTKLECEISSSNDIVKKKKAKKCTCCCTKNKEYANSLNELSTNISKYLEMNETSEIKKKKLDEWKLMAYILDRFFFWVFAFLTILFSVVLLFVIPLLKNLGYITRIKK